MRRLDAAPVAASRTSLQAGRLGDTPVKLVCLALALLVLIARIASIW